MKIANQTNFPPPAPSSAPNKNPSSMDAKPITDEVKTLATVYVQNRSHDDQHIINDPNVGEMTLESHTYDPERLNKVSQTLYFGGVADLFRGMQTHYQSFMSELKNTAPKLAESTSWGFSIDEKGEFVVNGTISDENKSYLEEKLNANEDLLELAKQVPALFMQGLAYDRGADGKGPAWGKFDVNAENFKDIIDFKEVFDESYSSMGDISFFKGNFDVLKYAQNVADQLHNKAEAKFGY
ncbi:hypothetical protein [Pseudoalteromonas umbrosa]|uniref:hypothetical protein n=1 Tax=Pseudoalteromonas umbrosa TaxID=3048489 RepID=UPI0024C2F564|nr:hypothetical protein [Pseudoalteromonas sp. B95]MDK1286345.1 hypothetical protein [Pseudoalteromonas sp. B95]